MLDDATWAALRRELMQLCPNEDIAQDILLALVEELSLGVEIPDPSGWCRERLAKRLIRKQYDDRQERRGLARYGSNVRTLKTTDPSSSPATGTERSRRSRSRAS